MESDDPEQVDKTNICPICERDFGTVAGLRLHVTKGHSDEEIQTAITINTQHLSQQPSTSNGNDKIHQHQPTTSQPIVWNKLQIMNEDVRQLFDIIDNEAGGDCLFLTLIDFMNDHKTSFQNIPRDVNELRIIAVNHILSQDINRFKDSIIINLENEIPGLVIKTKNLTSPEICKKSYSNYMLTPRNYGTTAELCAIAEVFGFDFYVIRQDSPTEYICYDYGSTESKDSNTGKKSVNLLFTGSVERGHFRYLNPTHDTRCLKIRSGKYQIAKDYTSSRLTSIAALNSSYITHTQELHTNSASITTTTSTTGAPVAKEKTQPDTTNLERMRDLLVFIQTVRAHTTVLRRIPKAARIQTAMELSNLITACIRPNAPFLAWAHLFTLSYIALKSPDRKNKSTKNLSIATIVKRNLDVWSKLKRLTFDEFVNNILSSLQRRKKSKNVKDAEVIRIKLVQAKLSDGDISGAILVLSSNDTLATVNTRTYQHLLEKHPQPILTIEVDNKITTEIQPVSVTEVKKSIFAFAAGSSGGMDGIRPQHLEDLVGKETGDHGEKVLESLSGFSDLCLNGEVPAYVTHFLYGASLCGLNKTDNSIRPIAIGDTLRRLVSRIASSRIAERTGDELRPKQLGYGTRGGCEAGVHSARHFVNFPHAAIKVLLKLDFKNAYNEIEGHPMLLATNEKCPEIFPFIHQCYAQPSWLTFGEFSMLSQRGCQQGDPCGPAIFCLGIHDMVVSLASELNIWYMDDGSLGGSPDMVFDDLQNVINKSSELGLQLNFSKCEIKILGDHSHDDRVRILERFNQIAPGIVDRPEDIELLGSPLTILGIRSAIHRKLEKLKTMVGRLNKLNAHHAYCLLRSSLSIPQLNYLLRTTPCWQSLDVLEEYDHILKSSIASIANCRFSERSWDEATLPVKLGGLGLRNATNLCYSSFLGSIHSVSDLVSNIVPSFSLSSDSLTAKALEAWSAISDSEILLEADRKLQHKWDFELCSKQHQRIVEASAVSSAKARILTNKSRESGAWLNAFPFSTLGTLLDNQSFRIAVSLRLGIPLCVKHTCVCGVQVDELGHHGLCCRKSAGRYACLGFHLR